MDSLKLCARIFVSFFRGRRNRLRALAVFVIAIGSIQFALIHFETSSCKLSPHYKETKEEKNRVRLINNEGLLWKRLSTKFIGNYSAKLLKLNGQTFSAQVLSRDGDEIVVRLKGQHVKKLWELSEHRPKEDQEQNRELSYHKEDIVTATIVEREEETVVRGNSSQQQQQQQHSRWENEQANKEALSHDQEEAGIANADAENVNKEIVKTKENASNYLQEQVTGREQLDVCPKLTLYTTNQSKAPYGICKPHRPTQAACKLAHKLYNENMVKRQCKVTQGTGDICHILEKPKINGKKREGIVHCENTICSAVDEFVNPFRVKTLDPQTGDIQTEKEFETVDNLEKGLVGILKKTAKARIYFVFVQCRGEKGDWISQLLPIDPRLTIREADSPRDPRAVNVNIILVDSVARAHFYRSLPRTVKTFQSWIDQPSRAPATVLDFELFQAVEGHTAENTHALFTGTFINPNSSGSVEMDVLFGHYKKAGYQTTWQEDLCFEGVWGLMLDLKAIDWRDMQRLSQEAHIDHTGRAILGGMSRIWQVL